jgi:DNA-directed RNA polymerase sigma subunit (sigma70/sigma32)
MNIGLVVSVCSRYKGVVAAMAKSNGGGGVTFSDLKQEASIGLIRAAEK